MSEKKERSYLILRKGTPAMTIKAFSLSFTNDGQLIYMHGELGNIRHVLVAANIDGVIEQ